VVVAGEDAAVPLALPELEHAPSTVQSNSREMGRRMRQFGTSACPGSPAPPQRGWQVGQ
jgi:hypothetical protein